MKKILLFLRLPVDLVLCVLTLPAGLVLLGYRKFGSARLPWTTAVLKRLGVFPLRNHYYEPLFDDRALAKPLSDDRDLPGLDLNEQAQLRFLERLTRADELTALQLDKPKPGGFDIFN